MITAEVIDALETHLKGLEGEIDSAERRVSLLEASRDASVRELETKVMSFLEARAAEHDRMFEKFSTEVGKKLDDLKTDIIKIQSKKHDEWVEYKMPAQVEDVVQTARDRRWKAFKGQAKTAAIWTAFIVALMQVFIGRETVWTMFQNLLRIIF